MKPSYWLDDEDEDEGGGRPSDDSPGGPDFDTFPDPSPSQDGSRDDDDEGGEW